MAVRLGVPIQSLTSLAALLHPDVVELVIDAYWHKNGEEPKTGTVDLGWSGPLIRMRRTVVEPAGSDIGAIEETVAFLDYFKELPDPRQAGKVIYPLAEVLLLCLLAVLAGAESFVDIARFGEKKIEFLRRFRPFHHGTPAHDHLGDIFAVLDAERFQRCFVDWVAALTGAPKEVVAIDGKTLRRSGEKKSAKAAIHMVSAFAARQRLVLGQVKVADKAVSAGAKIPQRSANPVVMQFCSGPPMQFLSGVDTSRPRRFAPTRSTACGQCDA